MNLNTKPYQDGRTVTSYSRDSSMRRDNDVIKVPKIGLYDIDHAIWFHLTNNWKPQLIENDVSIPVPVIFANGEKWSQIRAQGYLRDNSKKVQSPIIALKRNDVTEDERIQLLPGQMWGGNSNFYPKTKLIPYKRSGMQFDKVAGQYLTKESVEFYLIDVPDYVRLTYDLVIWTDLQEQMNVLVQGLIPMSNHIWGDYWKFRTVITSTVHENVNVPGEDRLIKTTMQLQVDGYLRNEYEYQQSKIQKAYSIKKVKFLQEGSEQIFFDQVNDLNEPNVEPTSDILQNQLTRKIR